MGSGRIRYLRRIVHGGYALFGKNEGDRPLPPYIGLKATNLGIGNASSKAATAQAMF